MPLRLFHQEALYDASHKEGVAKLFREERYDYET